MAILIPGAIRNDASRGERELFYRLKEDPLTEDWIILHSLDIKRHINQIEGEIDLVVLIPNKGVLCIEVKACDVTRYDGLWTYHYRPLKTSIKGPFKQASDAMHSLRGWLRNKDNQLSNILFYSAVVFTEINFKQSSPEWNSWQCINREDILKGSVATRFLDILDQAHKIVKDKHSWYEESLAKPSVKQLEKLSNLLRGDFQYFNFDTNEVQRAEEALVRLTDEQISIASQYSDNDRMLVRGPAGTGKTYIAIDAASWAVNLDKRVGLFCFNNLLGSWLNARAFHISEQAGQNGLNFYSGTLHKYLLSKSSLSNNMAAKRQKGFWSNALPLDIVNNIIAQSIPPVFDYLVIDEAQDLISPEYLDVFDLLLVGGLSSGKWLMLGDFEKQAIYAENATDLGRLDIDFLKKKANFATFNLRINCRNLKKISDTLTLASALVPGYKSNLLPDLEGQVEPRFYGPKNSQETLLDAVIRDLLKKYKPNQIVILSMKGLEDSIASSLPLAGGHPLRSYSNSNIDENAIKYSTIRMFKGMESQAIVLTDIYDLQQDMSKALLYIGMSRAKISLVMLMDEKLKSAYQELILSGLRRAL
ncbi:hypothetical protein G6688_05075 [Polynucleobacter paneuropaeus]|nr:hypothetical protein G6688_05075 [Polynucleobacter paneuropaeus]